MTPADLVPLLAVLAVLTRELLWVSGIGIALSSLDDIAVDTIWLARVAFRRAPALPPEPERPGRFAVIIPAWDESAVIGAMVQRLLATMQHPHFLLFVGAYPNDLATQEAVRSVADARVRLVVTSRPGPTTKADCLNHLWRAVLAEEAGGGRFKAIVLHDAEDVVHPQSLSVYDRHMPGLAMVQLPVVPLIDRRARWVSGHYADEFAQAHAKDMLVRAVLRAPVPSAGVGTAIDREVLACLAGADNAPFDAGSLTEDYEIGHKIHAMGLTGRMARVRMADGLVATRAYFPSTIEAAVQQKSRWLTGIALSGWDRLGWGGGPAVRWMLLRDRKGLFTAAIAVMGYGAALLLAAQLMLRSQLGERLGHPLPPLLGGASELLPWFLLFNAALLAWRLILRFWFTSRLYGPVEGLFAVPRAIVANAINFLAAVRAAERYRAMLGTGGTEWGKTQHRFPTDGELARNG
ncbi:glycosyl transferase family protein [Sandaracinobacteroides hominis]|uniref:glycosyl transferase family protein n=1 Tax=Sandaracinobacteroides hominis TaxID=2780086 RepID=UPI0018F6B8A9|nr:glycosyl transferase family protein [Sandaracinobacteroides hominis]